MERRREAYTMALNVAICLLAALAAVSEPAPDEDARTFELVWGTTVGLALAGFIAIVGYAVARRGGASGVRSMIDGASRSSDPPTTFPPPWPTYRAGGGLPQTTGSC